MRLRQVAGWTGLALWVLAFLPLFFAERFPSKEVAGATTVILYLLGIIVILAASPRRSSTQSNGTAEAAYLDRNLAVLAWARTLHDAGHRVGWRDRDAAWPILTMYLPTGQISYHLPRDALMAINLPDYEGDWDGHNLQQKQERVREYINAPTGGEA